MMPAMTKGRWRALGAAVVVLVGAVATVSLTGGHGRTLAKSPPTPSTASTPSTPSTVRSTSTGIAPASTTQTTAAVPPPVVTPAIPTQTLTGSQSARRPVTLQGGMTVFRGQNSGSSPFVVRLVDTTGLTVAVVFNTIGTFTGSNGQGLSKGSYVLNVQSGGAWTISIEQPRPASSPVLPTGYAGKGDTLVGPFQGRGSTRFNLHNAGSSNFVVELLDRSGQPAAIVANSLGNFDGSHLTETLNAPYYLNVTSNGIWSVGVTAA
jgi:hypothetical protein